MDHDQILHSDRVHVGGTNMFENKSKMADGCHRPSEPRQPIVSPFWKSKMAAAYAKNSKNHDFSTTDWLTLTKFGPLQRAFVMQIH